MCDYPPKTAKSLIIEQRIAVNPTLLHPPALSIFRVAWLVSCDQTSTDARALERSDTARLFCCTWKESRPIPSPSLLPEVEYLADWSRPDGVGLPTTRYRRGM